MNVLALDSETLPIRQGLLAPPLVCVTWQRPGHAARIVHQTDAEPVLREWLEEDDLLLVGHNIAFDFAVIAERYPALRELIFRAYDNDRVTDTLIRQKLLDNAAGVLRGRLDERGRWRKPEYGLQAVAKRDAGVELQKDALRLWYGEFIATSLDRWPERARIVQAKAAARLAELEARPEAGHDKKLRKEIEGLRSMIASDPERSITYATDDAAATMAVFLKQEEHAEFLADQFRQSRAAFWLHLGSAWGLRTDAIGVETLRSEAQAQYDEIEGGLVQLGLVRADGTRDTKAAKARMIHICARDGIPVRRTDAHASEGKCKDINGKAVADGDDERAEHVCLDADACNATGDDVLIDYAELGTLKKVLSNDVAALSKGIAYPVHTRYGLAETGRTTSSGPNIQNLRRRAGIREAFVPRAGRVFAACDYPQLELYTLAQCCVSWIGWSKLADALNAGLDPHISVAAQILGIPYEEAKANIDRVDVDNARQTAKVANFGFPGGLGIDKLILFAKKTYGVTLTYERAKRLKDQWFAAWPEMRDYFALINDLCDTDDGTALVETLFTQRFRGGTRYCAACNNGFQALGADCAKNAGWFLSYVQYVVRGSPLFNSRTVAFVHDEFIIEVDEAVGHDAANELAQVMREGANVYLPDVPIPASKMKPLLMRRWSKKAKPAFDEKGRLVPWT